MKTFDGHLDVHRLQAGYKIGCVYHAHQDVVSVMLCVLWMACVEPMERNLRIEENEPEPLTSPLVSNSQHNYTLRTRPISKSINHERANSRTTTTGSFV